MTVVDLYRETTDRMDALAEEASEPIRDLVIRRLRQYRSFRGAARSMGVTHQTLRQWCKRLDIEVRFRRERGGVV